MRPYIYHGSKKVNSMLGRLARSLSYRDKHCWLKLYRIYVRPHLEYCVQAWAPWTVADVDLLENVQKRALRMTSGLTGSTYEEKLAEVGLMSLSDRRARGDMIETWKIINEKNHWPDSNILKCSSDRSTRVTRGSANQALVKDTSSLALRSNFFSNRVVNPCSASKCQIRFICGSV